MTAKKKPGSQGEGPGRYGRDAGLVIGAIIPAPTDAAGFNDRAHIPQLPTNLEVPLDADMFATGLREGFST